MVKGMECLSIRQASFSKKRTKWPHNSKFLATPATLAEAGFYYSPAPGEKDNVACYMCHKNMGEWEKDDDPFQLHWEKCGKTGKCPWAIVRCSEDIDFTQRSQFREPDRYPTSQVLKTARRKTFGIEGGWPHDDVHNHGANSTKMAEAGFIFSPQEPGDDLAACLYCQISLNGWDEDDNPLDEHRKREPSCLFLQFLDEKASHPPLARLTSAKPSTSKSRTHTRTASKTHHDILMPVKTFDGSDDEDQSVALSVATTRQSMKTPAKKAKTTAKTPRTTRKPSKTPSRRKVPADDDEYDHAPATEKKRGGRSMSVVQTDDSDTFIAPPTEKKRRGRPKSVVNIDDSDPFIAPPTEKKRKGRGKSVVPSESEAERPASTEVKRRRRTRAKSTAPPIGSETESDLNVPKMRRGKSKVITESEDEHTEAPMKKRLGKSAIPSEIVTGDSHLSKKVSRTKKQLASSSRTRSRVLSENEDPHLTIRQRSLSPEPEIQAATSTLTRTTRGRSMARGRSLVLDIPDDDDDDTEVVIPPPLKIASTKSTSKVRNKSRAPSAVPMHQDEDNADHKRNTRSQSVARSVADSQMRDESSDERPVIIKRKASRIYSDVKMDIVGPDTAVPRSRPSSRTGHSSRLGSNSDHAFESSRSSRQSRSVTGSRQQPPKADIVMDAPVPKPTKDVNDADDILQQHLPSLPSPSLEHVSPIDIEFPPLESPLHPVVLPPPTQPYKPSSSSKSGQRSSRPPSRIRASSRARASSRPPSIMGSQKPIEILSDDDDMASHSQSTAAPIQCVRKMSSRIIVDVDTGQQQRKGSIQIPKERETEKLENARKESERLEIEREKLLKKERLERDRLEKEEEEREKLLEKERVERERLEREEEELERLEDERQERVEREERERLEREEQERLEDERQEREQRERRAQEEKARKAKERLEKEERKRKDKEEKEQRQKAERERKEVERRERREKEERERQEKEEQMEREEQEQREREEREEKEEQERDRLRLEHEERIAKELDEARQKKEQEKQQRKESLRRREEERNRLEKVRLEEEERQIKEERRKEETAKKERQRQEREQRKRDEKERKAEEKRRLEKEEEERLESERLRLEELEHTSVEDTFMEVSQEDIEMDGTEGHLDPDKMPSTPPRPVKQLPKAAKSSDDNNILRPSAINSPHRHKEGTKKSSSSTTESKPSGDMDHVVLAAPFEQHFFPALSSTAFGNLTDLPENELDMTVEEWIRFQMEQELEKFRSDALAELERFSKEAMMRRTQIESLEVKGRTA